MSGILHPSPIQWRWIMSTKWKKTGRFSFSSNSKKPFLYFFSSSLNWEEMWITMFTFPEAEPFYKQVRNWKISLKSVRNAIYMWNDSRGKGCVFFREFHIFNPPVPYSFKKVLSFGKCVAFLMHSFRRKKKKLYLVKEKKNQVSVFLFQYWARFTQRGSYSFPYLLSRPRCSPRNNCNWWVWVSLHRLRYRFSLS